MEQEFKFWQGTNFWIALVLAIGGMFVGFPENEAKTFVVAVFALIGAAGAVREKVKDLQIDWRAWLASKNTWNYLATVITAIFPFIPVDLFARLSDLFQSLMGGNWQGVVTAVFSIATMLYYIFVKPKPAAQV